MLYMASDSAKTVRLQGTWVSDQELEQLVAFWKDQSVGAAPALAEIDSTADSQAIGRPGDTAGILPLAPWSDDEEPEQDELLPQAIEVVRQAGRASASLLQRKLRIGYSRAGRLIDLLEEQGVVGGPAEGGRAREVLDTVVPSEEAAS
jgi:S-DNA-T family DNA segregation ATPase FtsK/SpoIIIE